MKELESICRLIIDSYKILFYKYLSTVKKGDLFSCEYCQLLKEILFLIKSIKRLVKSVFTLLILDVSFTVNLPLVAKVMYDINVVESVEAKIHINLFFVSNFPVWANFWRTVNDNFC